MFSTGLRNNSVATVNDELNENEQAKFDTQAFCAQLRSSSFRNEHRDQTMQCV